MKPMKQVMMAGLVAAALGVAPVGAQETGTGGTSQTQTESQTGSQSGTSSDQTGTTGSQTATQAGSQAQANQQQGGGGADQEAVRQHLAAARQSLAELTQLPAAGQLQGEPREQIANFISRFNEFATATTDWREKYDAVDESLTQILDTADAGAPGAAATPTPSSEASTGAQTDAAGETATAGGSFDPTIIAKLRETREHLDAFELATGDPGFVAERIEKILDNAASATSAAEPSSSSTVGTTGAVQQGSGESATGMVTLSQSQIEDIRRHLEMLKRR